MRLKILTTDATGKRGQVWLDGVDRSNDVVSVRLSLGAKEVTHATIEFILRDGVDVDIDGAMSVIDRETDTPWVGDG